jgi:hypothetical protein
MAGDLGWLDEAAAIWHTGTPLEAELDERMRVALEGWGADE